MSRGKQLLIQWMAGSGRSEAAAAREIGCSQSNLNRIINNSSRQAGLGLAFRIEQVTGGAVPAGSWLEPAVNNDEPVPDCRPAA